MYRYIVFHGSVISTPCYKTEELLIASQQLEMTKEPTELEERRLYIHYVIITFVQNVQHKFFFTQKIFINLIHTIGLLYVVMIFFLNNAFDKIFFTFRQYQTSYFLYITLSKKLQLYFILIFDTLAGAFTCLAVDWKKLLLF